MEVNWDSKCIKNQSWSQNCETSSSSTKTTMFESNPGFGGAKIRKRYTNNASKGCFLWHWLLETSRGASRTPSGRLTVPLDVHGCSQAAPKTPPRRFLSVSETLQNAPGTLRDASKTPLRRVQAPRTPQDAPQDAPRNGFWKICG